MKRWIPCVGVLAITMSSCAYSAAMNKGGRAAADGNWPMAVIQYEKAMDSRDKDEAQAAYVEARDHAVADAVDAALIGIGSGSYETAVDQLDYVSSLDDDNADVYSLRIDCEAAMASDIDAQWELGNPRLSYTLAIRMRKLFPDSEGLPGTFNKLREHYKQEAIGLLRAKKFPESLAAARTITDFEPDRDASVAPLEQEIRTTWADDTNQRARAQNRAGNKGAGAALYARSYEIAGRKADLESSQYLARQLRSSGQLMVDIRVTGPSSRAAQIREILTGNAGQLNDVVLGTGSSTLVAQVTVAPARCAETKEVTPESKPYISGQIEIDNPRHGALTEQLAQASTLGDRAGQEAEQLWPEVQQAEQSLEFFDIQMMDAERVANAEAAKLATATAQMQGAMNRRDELMARLDELRAAGPGTEATIAREETELGKTGRVIAEWQGEVLESQMKSDAAASQVSRLTIERQPAQDALDRLKGGYEAVLQDRTAFQQQRTELASELANTSRTIWEDVHETLNYDVHNWTRTCPAPVRVTMRPRWRTELPTTSAYDPTESTRDSSHIGHVKADLQADPKLYPDTDTALVAASDGRTAAEVSSWMGRLVDDYYEYKTVETTMALLKDPIRATSPMLGLYLGGRSHLDDATITTFAAHVRQHYGLEKIELLSVDNMRVSNN